MNSLNGIPLPYFPITDMKHVRDLAHFDGPLISHYERSNGDDYLYYWVDCDEHFNRWMILRVSESSVIRLIDKFVPLSFVIPGGCRDEFVYFVDINGDGDVCKTQMLPTKKIPAEYKPEDDAYLAASESKPSEDSYSILVEGNWSVNDLAGIPDTFEKVYSFLYGLNVLHRHANTSLPWRGGFSAMHYFKDASKQIPSEHRPSVLAIQVASPGFMKFKLHGDTAREVNQCISDFKNNNVNMSRAYGDLERYIRDNDLNEKKEAVTEPRAPIQWEKHNGFLQEKTIEILKEFTAVSEPDFFKSCSRPFEAAKIAMAVYRIVRELNKYEKDGLVRYSGV